jgi:hypothetical protein
MHSLHHIREEPESEVQTEQTKVKETNTKLDQGKLQCIPPIILSFSSITIFMLRLIVH